MFHHEPTNDVQMLQETNEKSGGAENSTSTASTKLSFKNDHRKKSLVDDYSKLVV